MKPILHIRLLLRSAFRSLFSKVLAVCFSLSLLIVLFFIIFANTYILNNFDSQIDNYEQQRLEETKNTVTLLFAEVNKTALNYAQNPIFLSYNNQTREEIMDRYLEVKSSQSMLACTTNSSNFIRNIFLYYEKNDYLLDATGAYDLNSYYDKSWVSGFNSLTTLTAVLPTHQAVIRASSAMEANDSVITYIAKLPIDGSAKEGAVVINLDVRILDDVLKGIVAGDASSLALIIDGEGSIQASSKESLLYQPISGIMGLSRVNGSNRIEKHAYTKGNTKMISYMADLGINNWKLCYIKADNLIYLKSRTIRNITLSTCCALLVFTLILSIIFTFKLYSPIRRITSSVRSILKPGNDDSDVSMIQQSLSMLFDNNRSLQEQVQQNRKLAGELFMSQLISNRLLSRQEIINRAEYLQITHRDSMYIVAAVEAAQIKPELQNIEEQDIKHTALINTIRDVFEKIKIEAICSQDLDDNIIVIFRLDSSINRFEQEAAIEQALWNIQQNVSSYLDLAVNIGIGSAYEDLSNISLSYREALEALHFKFLKGSQVLINIKDIRQKENGSFYYPTVKEQKLILLVEACDYEKAVLCLHDMLEEIFEKNKDFVSIEACLSDVIGILTKCVYKFKLNIHEVFSDENIHTVTSNQFRNTAQFVDWMSLKIRMIIDTLLGQQKGSTKSFADEVKVFLNEHYMQEISLDSVAGHFNYNYSYFCKIFKEKMGSSFWDYLACIRIEKSKKLLEETELGIEKIAEMVGYNNRFSYIRTFKQLLDCTPSEYRAKMKLK